MLMPAASPTPCPRSPPCSASPAPPPTPCSAPARSRPGASAPAGSSPAAASTPGSDGDGRPMRGSVRKRCQCRDAEGRRVRNCRKAHGSWFFVIDAGHDPLTGKRRQITRSGFRTRDEADEAMTKELAALDAGTWTDDQGITLGDWLDQWLSEFAERVDGGPARQDAGALPVQRRQLLAAPARPPAAARPAAGHVEQGPAGARPAADRRPRGRATRAATSSSARPRRSTATGERCGPRSRPLAAAN